MLKVWGELPDKYSLTVESTADFSIHQMVETVYEKLTDKPKSLSSFIGKFHLVQVTKTLVKPLLSDIKIFFNFSFFFNKLLVVFNYFKYT